MLRRTVGAVLGALLALSAMGCAGPKSASAGEGESSSASSQITIGIEPFVTLDPGQGRAPRGDLAIISQLYSSLTTVNADGELVGDLALDWEMVSENEWVFDLRDDAQFEDGTPVNAEVVKWNLERLLDPENAMAAASNMQLIEAVTAPSEYQVSFTTTAPFLDLPRRLAWTYLLEPNWAGANDPSLSAMGSGPYSLVSLDTDGDTVLVRNEKYYGEKAGFKDVTYRVVSDENSRLAGLKSGELDLALGLDPLTIKQLQGTENLEAGAIDANKMQTLRINTAAPFMDDLRVRKALNYAIDRESITKSIYNGLVEPGSTQLLGALYDGFDKSRHAWPYDPKKAKKLLAEAGHSDDITLRLGVAETGYVGASQASQAIADQLAQVGITVEIETIPYAKWVEYLRDENGPALTFIAWGSQSISSPEILFQLHSSAPYGIGHANAEYDQAVTAANGAATPEDKLAAIRQAVDIVEDQALTVYLWPQPQTYARSTEVDWKVRMDDWVRASDAKPVSK